MQWLVLIVIGILWFIGWVISEASRASSRSAANRKKKQEFLAERDKKYKNRGADSSKDLFVRNIDIIREFEKKISPRTYQNYYIENETRDCINEIALAENEPTAHAGPTYLSAWQAKAPSDWLALSKKIHQVLSDRQRALRELENKVSETRARLKSFENERIDPAHARRIGKRAGRGEIVIGVIDDILKPNKISWTDEESELINFEAAQHHFARFPDGFDHSSVKELNREIDQLNAVLDSDDVKRQENKEFFDKILAGYKKGSKADVIQRLDLILNDVLLTVSLPKFWDVDFDPDQSIAIVEISLPDVVHSQVLKEVKLKTGIGKKPLNQKEVKEYVPKIHPAIILRIAYEIYRNDFAHLIKLLVVNGWVEFDDPNTGLKTRTYTASLAVEKNQILSLNLEKLDPLSAFISLKGKTAGKLIDIIPITPIMSLNTEDKRFIPTKEVLNKLGSETNLASMDWQDFESLIAELFEKEFAKEGAEVKVTQASRDRGVDAVVFDPDPIKGGKFIVQAKRYTNTVDVSAVRDLCAVVKKEGASKGILVTTSTYGADAYAFAQNEPITLLNGSELLGLLGKHGYKFRINLQEARKLNNLSA